VARHECRGRVAFGFGNQSRVGHGVVDNSLLAMIVQAVSDGHPRSSPVHANHLEASWCWSVAIEESWVSLFFPFLSPFQACACEKHMHVYLVVQPGMLKAWILG
jgi:hypothetical protein